MKQKIFIAALGLLAIAVYGKESESPSQSMEKFLEMAQQRNPEIRALRATVEALRSRPTSVRVWDNPVIGYSKENDPGGDTVTHWRAEQEIPFPGKRTLDATTAAHEADAMDAQVLAKSFFVRAQARSLLFRLHRTKQMARLLSEQMENVEALAGSVRGSLSRIQGKSSAGTPRSLGGMGRLDAGEGGSAYFALESERVRLGNALLLENQEYRSSVMELNALLDRPLRTPVEPFELPPIGYPKETVDQLQRRALQSGSARLRSLSEEQAARSRLKQARLSFAPDFAFMYDRMTDTEGMKGAETGVSASVPLWWNGPRGEVSEARAALRSAELFTHSMALESERAVFTRYDELETRINILRNIKTLLLPSARSAFQIQRSRFESGQTDVADLVATLRGIVMAEMDYQQALEEWAVRWSALEQEVGGPVELGRPEEKNR